MFTGIVQTMGTLIAREPHGAHGHGDLRLRFSMGGLAPERFQVGDSLSVSGVCLTVTEHSRDEFRADVSTETLDCTTLGTLAVGDRVNLETALTPSTALGGHLVSGHVDGTGEVIEQSHDARSTRMRIQAPGALARYIAAKGSVCIDGVSLTVNAVDGAVFSVNVVPHTLAVTTLGEFTPGRPVNLEVDLIARYLERLLEDRSASGHG